MFKFEGLNFKYLFIIIDFIIMGIIVVYRVVWLRGRVVGGGNMGGSCCVYIDMGIVGFFYEEGE